MRAPPAPIPLHTRTLLVASLGSVTAVAQENPGDQVTRPAYQFLRQDEDWSSFSGMTGDGFTDFWDPLKHVPLNEDGSSWISFGGSAKLRWEGWRDFNFGTGPTSDDSFLLWQILAHADLHLGDGFRAFVQGKHAYNTDRDLVGGNLSLFRDSLALEQAFADVVADLDQDADVTLRAGRQALLFGRQRLVSPAPWSNVRRRWDGVSAIYQGSEWQATGFYAVFAPTQKYEFNSGNSDLPLWGLYTTGKIPGSEVGADLYYLGFGNRLGPTWNGTTGNETRHTVGTRIFGAIGSAWDYDAELAYQFGEVGGGDVSAYMLSGEMGYTFSSAAWSPRALLGFDLGSGDDSPGGDVQTFNQLYAQGHRYLGFIDTIGRQNIIAPNVGLVGKPNPDTTLAARYYHFWRESTADAVYNPIGLVVRPGSAGTEREVGGELDLTARYRFDRHTRGLLGYSHFFAGDFIAESGASEDIDFFYVEVEYVF